MKTIYPHPEEREARLEGCLAQQKQRETGLQSQAASAKRHAISHAGLRQSVQIHRQRRSGAKSTRDFLATPAED